MTADERVGNVLDHILELGEVGIQVAAYLNGEKILEQWAGVTDADAGTPVDATTVFPIFSVTKAVAVTALHMQAERGLLDYDAPVAQYWPEYGQKGKEAITVRHVISHRAGVPVMPPDVTTERLCDWDWMVSRLAELEPVYPPGTRNTYLSYTFGWLVGELVCRTDPKGRPFGQFVQEEICVPLGLDSFWIGIPEEEQHRVAKLTYPNQPAPPDDDSLRALAAPPQVFFTPELFNRPEVQRACIPGANGIANARSVARFFALIAAGGELDGVRLLSPERIETFLEPRPDFDVDDEVYGKVQPVGMGGFHLHPQGVVPISPPGSRILCHIGAGSSLGWADLDSGLSLAICHNRMTAYAPNPPYPGLLEAIQELAAAAVAS